MLVFVVDDALQPVELRLDFVELPACSGVEEDFLEQVVVFTHQPSRDVHVPLESGAWCILMLHNAGKYKCACKGYRQ